MPKHTPVAFPRLQVQMTARSSKEQRQKEAAMQEMIKKKSLRSSGESQSSHKKEETKKTPSSARLTRSKKEQLKKLERAKRAEVNATQDQPSQKEETNAITTPTKSSPISKKSKTHQSPKKRKSIEVGIY